VIAAACHPIPVVLVLHNDPQAMSGARESTQRDELLRRFARIVCVSDSIRRQCMEGVGPPERAAPLVMINPVDFTELPAPPATRENLILFVGRVVPEKGTDTFVIACAVALASLPGWRAEVIGADRFQFDSPETDFTSQVRRQAGTVVLRGYQPHAAVLQAMSRASIVVMPSRWQDPCPLTALEAMACGAALITTRRGGLPEIAGDAAVYADPDSPADFARAILGLAQNRERLDLVRYACHERVRRFDLPRTAARWDAMRRDVMADRPC
jgi:UDP-glucose:(glucosyl)LPS alpha-1,2-glucosyltransferase